MRIQVSPAVNGGGIVGRLFWDFDGKPITLPQGKECYPQEGFVAWHRREVFRGEGGGGKKHGAPRPPGER